MGGASAIGLMVTSARYTGHPAISFPFTTSIVLVMAAPESRPARPWNVVGGHVLSALTGLGTVAVLGQGDLAAALGVGIAIAAMIVSDALHPPAGINALMPAYLPLDWHFLVMPVAVGSVGLVLFARAFHRLAGRPDDPNGDMRLSAEDVPTAAPSSDGPSRLDDVEPPQLR